MLIRSQDKTCLTNLAQVTDIYYNGSGNGTEQYMTAMLSNGEKTHLGIYSTEEKVSRCWI